MTDRSDDYSYLDDDETDDGLDDLELSERDTAIVVALPDLDYDSQLIAIRNLLEHYRKAEDQYNDQIGKAAQLVRAPGPTRHPLEESFRQQDWIDQMHYSTYHCAAHSMSVVGFIAKLVETIFYQSFREIERTMMKDLSTPTDHERWQRPAEDQWDCRYVWKNGRRSGNLVEGIMQLGGIHLTGVSRHGGSPRAIRRRPLQTRRVPASAEASAGLRAVGAWRRGVDSAPERGRPRVQAPERTPSLGSGMCGG